MMAEPEINDPHYRYQAPMTYCSFCGKSRHEVFYLVAGPTIFICDECVALCAEIVADKRKAAKGGSETVIASCGCVFCDLELETETVAGRRMHQVASRSSDVDRLVPCTRGVDSPSDT